MTSASSFTLTTGGATLQVGAATSSRVASLKYLGTEMLYTVTTGGNTLWGSTLWVSPQTNWTAACKSASTLDCFPPPAALDGNAYTGGIEAADTTLTFTGTADSYTHLRFRKTFSASLKDSSFTNLYHLINTSGGPISWAPWEDTRFPSGGVTFWPSGNIKAFGNDGMLKQTHDTLGATWFTYDSSASLTGRTKIFGDAGVPGWMAHVDKSRNLFIKKFADTPPDKQAPGTESECEIYVTGSLLEMELQGPYGPIPANDSIGWQVQWFVRKLPENIAVGRNKALLDFVNQTVGSAVTGVLPNRNGTEDAVRMRRSGRSIILEVSRPMDLEISLFDLRGKSLAR